MESCVGALIARHSLPAHPKAAPAPAPGGVGGDDGNVNGKGEYWRSKQSSGIERLNQDLMELAVSVNLLGSSWNVEMIRCDAINGNGDGDGVTSAGTGELNTKTSEEEWIDVLEEDAIGKDNNNSTAKGSTERVPDNDHIFPPPLSLERMGEMLTSITTTSRILETVHTLHLATCQLVQITDFLGNAYELPAVNLAARLKARYETGPGSALMKDRHFKLLNFQNRSIVVNADGDESWDDGKKLLLALVLSHLPDVGAGRCPMPDCAECLGEAVANGGWICPKCGVWFDQTVHSQDEDEEEDKVDEEALTVGESSSSSSSITASLRQSGESSTGLRSVPRHPQIDNLKEVKYVQTTQLVTFPKPVEDGDKFFRCRNCNTHLALQAKIGSGNFRGHHGRALLLSSVVNVTRGIAMWRSTAMGKHQVCDVFCRQCGEYVGWGYEGASEPTERYKVGKVVLELEMLTEEGLMTIGKD